MQVKGRDVLNTRCLEEVEGTPHLPYDRITPVFTCPVHQDNLLAHVQKNLKKCFGIRGNPRREKTFELFGVNAEKMVMARKQKFLEVLIDKQHCKCKIEVRDGWLPELLNFALERMMPGFKGSKVCSWGEKLNFKHLVCNCIHLNEWRKRFNKIWSSNYDAFLRQVIRRIKKGDKREVEEANVMAKDFYSTIVQTIVGIWN